MSVTDTPGHRDAHASKNYLISVFCGKDCKQGTDIKTIE